MADALTVRRAGEHDRDAWQSLWEAWQAHMDGRVPDHITASSWRKMIEPDSGLFAVIAFEQGRPLGFGNVSHTPFAWTGDEVLFLQDLFVTPYARGKGVGAALLMAIYAEADRLKASQVFWMVDEKDPELQAFYDRHAMRTPYLRYMRGSWPW